MSLHRFCSLFHRNWNYFVVWHSESAKVKIRTAHSHIIKSFFALHKSPIRCANNRGCWSLFSLLCRYTVLFLVLIASMTASVDAIFLNVPQNEMKTEWINVVKRHKNHTIKKWLLQILPPSNAFAAFQRDKSGDNLRKNSVRGNQIHRSNLSLMSLCFSSCLFHSKLVFFIMFSVTFTICWRKKKTGQIMKILSSRKLLSTWN